VRDDNDDDDDDNDDNDDVEMFSRINLISKKMYINFNFFSKLSNDIKIKIK
jgi:hypothetical protein